MLIAMSYVGLREEAAKDQIEEVSSKIRGSDLGIGKGIREDLKIFDGA